MWVQEEHGHCTAGAAAVWLDQAIISNCLQCPQTYLKSTDIVIRHPGPVTFTPVPRVKLFASIYTSTWAQVFLEQHPCVLLRWRR